jgi:hypothetical protein
MEPVMAQLMITGFGTLFLRRGCGNVGRQTGPLKSFCQLEIYFDEWS